ncbi:unnamed protein product [Rotaria sp. Silwood2]|nr:unnamed protein product [Rotaria sp. Silwood2]CAF2925645.1 unnamed protein product [Rotaria sp. Silwood2]CAF3202761.1 unnamed protein product [Rotaria sp. Silwood2]CAF3340923.1 unnamed protein product [Rotaria sp. Silwood2]CAF3913909.1 unnamed protein product [Rotaria sp. Silwood2]
MSETATEYIARHQKVASITAIVFGSISLLFLCVSIGTPAWHIDYDSTGVTVKWYTNFFYTCYNTNGTCWNNQYLYSSVVDYYEQPLTKGTGVATDYYLRLRNAAALGIIGLLFVAFGLVANVCLCMPSTQFKKFEGRLNLLAAVLLAIAALFQRAAMSEGEHVFSVNGYSGNLYRAGHALTIAAVPLCAFVAGRIYF